MVEVQDLVKMTDHSRGIWRIYLDFIKKIKKDRDMTPVGLGNTGILTGYAHPKTPGTRVFGVHVS